MWRICSVIHVILQHCLMRKCMLRLTVLINLCSPTVCTWWSWPSSSLRCLIFQPSSWHCAVQCEVPPAHISWLTCQFFLQIVGGGVRPPSEAALHTCPAQEQTRSRSPPQNRTTSSTSSCCSAGHIDKKNESIHRSSQAGRFERLCQTCPSPSHVFVYLSIWLLTLSLSALCASLFLTHRKRQGGGMFRLNRLQQSVIHFPILSFLCSLSSTLNQLKTNSSSSSTTLLSTNSLTLIAPKHSHGP